VIFSLRLRMMIAVGLLAVAAVVAVAMAARQGTRSGFRRFLELEKLPTSVTPGADRERIARLLSGRCCNSDLMRAASAALPPDEVLVITDPADSVIARAGKPLAGLNDFRF